MRRRRRALRRAWRAMTWPLSAHIVFALATGLACGLAVAHYEKGIPPPYAAALGMLVVYPLVVAAWRGFHRLRGVD
jgi:hypothetical protein